VTIPFIIFKIWTYTHKLTKTYSGRTDVQIYGQRVHPYTPLNVALLWTEIVRQLLQLCSFCDVLVTWILTFITHVAGVHILPMQMTYMNPSLLTMTMKWSFYWRIKLFWYWQWQCSQMVLLSFNVHVYAIKIWTNQINN
jgi:hypothetical protein